LPRRALLSVSDKSGLPDFARSLAALGFELYSTGGTLEALKEEGIQASPVSDLTGFPEILDGRVKTLHPGVHGGLLARRDKPEHLAALTEHGLKTIDLLCVNLYPFVATATREGVSSEEVIENIDIGGPAMIRAAAKNHEAVLVVVRPERYADVLLELGGGEVAPELRRELAAEAYAHTAYYDAAVAGWLREDLFPPELPLAGRLVQRLRYGENPHQQAGFYRLPSAIGGLGTAKQLQGGELMLQQHPGRRRRLRPGERVPAPGGRDHQAHQPLRLRDQRRHRRRLSPGVRVRPQVRLRRRGRRQPAARRGNSRTDRRDLRRGRHRPRLPARSPRSDGAEGEGAAASR